MSENEELSLASEEFASYIMFSIPVICSTATIAVLACGIGFILSAVLKTVFSRNFDSWEYESLKRKRTPSEDVPLTEWSGCMKQDIEEEFPDDQYLIRRTRSGCAYGVYHLKKPQIFPELEEFTDKI